MLRTIAKEVHELLDVDMYKEAYFQNIMYHKLCSIPYLSVHKEVDILYFKSHSTLPFGRGRMDIVIIDAWNQHHIIELKVNSKQMGMALKQAARYLEHYTYGAVASCTVINWLQTGVQIKSLRVGQLRVKPIGNNLVYGSGISSAPTVKKISLLVSRIQDSTVYQV